MTDYDFVQAATSGVRLLWRNPKVFAAWSSFSLIVFSVFMAVILLTFGEFFSALVQTSLDGTEPTGAELLGLLGRFALGALLMFPLYLFYVSVQQAAAIRAMLRPEDDGLGYLRFGGDEFRMGLAVILLTLVKYAVQIVFTVLGVLFGLAMAAPSGGADTPGGAVGMQLMMQLWQIPMYVVLVYLLLRLSMAPSVVLDAKRANVFASWSLTKGKAGGIFVTYLVAGLMSFCLGILTVILVAAVVAGVGMGSFAALSQMENNPALALHTIGSLAIPIGLGLVVMGALLAPIYAAIFYCPAAYIYRRTIAASPEQVF